MNWNGLLLELAFDCEPDEDFLAEVEFIDDDSDVCALIEDKSPPGLVCSPEAGQGPRITDGCALGAWIEKRLSADEWSTLHEEFAGIAKDAADDAGETLMRDRAAGVA